MPQVVYYTTNNLLIMHSDGNKLSYVMSALRNRHCIYYGTDEYGNDKIPFGDVCRTHDPLYKTAYDRTYQGCTNMHFGQRKLLLSEIQLLTAYYESDDVRDDPIIVYVGAAPGSHLTTLSKLFPRAKFILYDLARFDSHLYNNPTMYDIRHEYFTDDTCIKILKEVDANRLLFVSDIRKSIHTVRDVSIHYEPDSAFEDSVMNDMDMQQKWVLAMKPRMSLLKFRLPYNLKTGDKLNLLEGKLMFGVWARPTSGETRLLIDAQNGFTCIDYDFKLYEETQAFHNKYVRTFGFASALETYRRFMVGNNTYCPCYDCYAELSILERYCNLECAVQTDLEAIVKMVKDMDAHRAFWKGNVPPLQSIHAVLA